MALLLGTALIEYLVIPIYDFAATKTTIPRVLILGANGILYSVFYIFLFFTIPVLIHEGDFDYYLSRVQHYFIYDFHNTVKNYLFIVAVLYAFEYLAKEKGSLMKQKQMEIELSQTKFKMLKSQLQPHFLFNALNSVVAVIDENKHKAQEMLISLSDILRVSLRTDFRKTHNLNEERNLIEKYLSIEQNRYEEQLEYQFKIDESAEKLQVPIMLLQPIVENAIKHGFKGINKTLRIVIEADAGKSKIRIKNNGAPLNKALIKGTGLNQVIERLRLMNPKIEALELKQYEGWVICEIRLK